MFKKITNLSNTAAVVVADRTIAIGASASIPAKAYQKWYDKGGKRLVTTGVVGEEDATGTVSAAPPILSAPAGEGENDDSGQVEDQANTDATGGDNEGGDAGDVGEDAQTGTDVGSEGPDAVTTKKNGNKKK